MGANERMTAAEALEIYEAQLWRSGTPHRSEAECRAAGLLAVAAHERARILARLEAVPVATIADALWDARQSGDDQERNNDGDVLTLADMRKLDTEQRERYPKLCANWYADQIAETERDAEAVRTALLAAVAGEGETNGE